MKTITAQPRISDDQAYRNVPTEKQMTIKCEMRKMRMRMRMAKSVVEMSGENSPEKRTKFTARKKKIKNCKKNECENQEKKKRIIQKYKKYSVCSYFDARKYEKKETKGKEREVPDMGRRGK